jgi:predicted NUDIX family phosphoesterase
MANVPKEQQIIAVAPKFALFSQEQFNDFYFNGFSAQEKHDYEKVILEHLMFMRRGNSNDPTGAEGNPEFKQPIGYGLIINPVLKKAFAYQRKGDEERLSGKYSFGVGGHIEQEDISPKDDNPIRAAFLRELSEEVQILGNILNVKVLGYVNDDSNPNNEKVTVGMVHIGILYAIETDATEVRSNEKQILKAGLVDLSELERIARDEKLESWSQIAFGPLKQHYFKN